MAKIPTFEETPIDEERIKKGINRLYWQGHTGNWTPNTKRGDYYPQTENVGDIYAEGNPWQNALLESIVPAEQLYPVPKKVQDKMNRYKVETPYDTKTREREGRANLKEPSEKECK